MDANNDFGINNASATQVFLLSGGGTPSTSVAKFVGNVTAGGNISGSSTSTGSFGQGFIADNLGIGHNLTTHSQKLVVKRNAAATTLTAGVMVNLVNEQGAGNTATLRFTGAQQNAYLGYFDGSGASNQKLAIGVGSGGTGNGQVTITGEGRVGIGTSSPSTLLHVKGGDGVIGTLEIQGGNNTVSAVGEVNTQLDFGSNDASVGNNLPGARISSITEFNNGAYVGMGFSTYQQSRSPELLEHMRITNAGKIGIGTTSPAVQLHLSSSTANNFRLERSGASNAAIHFKNASEDWYAGVTSAANFSISRNADIASGTEFVIRGNTGRVGIGTSNPDGELHVHAASAGTVTAPGEGNNFIIEDTATPGMSILMGDTTKGSIYWGSPSDNDRMSIIGDIGNSRFDFAARHAADVMRFRPAGGVLNLTLKGAAGSEMAQFEGDVSGSATSTGSFGALEVRGAGQEKINFFGNAQQYLNFGDAADSDSGRIQYDHNNNQFQFYANATNILRVLGSGYVLPGSNRGVSLGISSVEWKELVVNHITASGNISGSSTSTGSFGHGFIDGRLGVGTNSPDSKLHIYEGTGTTASSTGTSLFTLTNYVGADLNQQKTFIDFTLLDDNSNETPQVRIGAEVGHNGDANTQQKEGSGAFVVYTNNADTTSGDAGTSLAERMRVDYQGFVGIGTDSPGAKLEVIGNISGSATSTGSFGMVHAEGIRGLGGTYGGTLLVPEQLALGNDTDTMIRKYTSNVLEIRAGGSDLIRFDGNNGKVIVESNLEPDADNTYNLGAEDKRWANIYTGDLELSNEGTDGNEVDGTTGKWTIQEGDEDLFIINRKTGKKYKFLLEEM